MTDHDLTQEQKENLLELLRVIAEPNRLQILNLLMEGVQCNCEIGNNLQMAPNLISHHLGVLREAGLVKAERDENDARWIYYSVDTEAILQLRSMIDQFFDLGRIKPRQNMCGPKQSSR
jgi:ArsR family transcriptional regulator